MAKKLWIVGRLRGPSTNEGVPPWEFFGVFDTEALAVAACTSPEFFVGPAALNVRFQDEPTPWPGAYIPVAERKS